MVKETEEDAKLAEEEWKRVTQEEGLSQFTRDAFGGSAAGGGGRGYRGAVCDAGGGEAGDAEQAVWGGGGVDAG